jgi:16S rRNA (uracil1498-N3)-methyltransferase
MGRARHIPRVFVEAGLTEGGTILLPDAKRQHLATVLRLAAGAPLILFNGDGGEYDATLIRLDRKHAEARIDKRSAPERESPLAITLVQAIARGDRMYFSLAKAVELGVAAIQPVFTARGQVALRGDRLAKKQSHWQRVVEAAAEQSGRLVRPPLAPACSLREVLAKPPAADQRLVLEPRSNTKAGALAPVRRAALLIGPESGLSDDEIALAEDANWSAISLGPRTLRTETAGMAALAALQALWGDLAGHSDCG